MIAKNKQALIEQKEELFQLKKHSLILSSILETDFLLKLGGKKGLEEWRDIVLDDMNRLKKRNSRFKK